MRLEGENRVFLVDETLMIRGKVDEAGCWFGNLTHVKFRCSLLILQYIDYDRAKKEDIRKNQRLRQMGRNLCPHS